MKHEKSSTVSEKWVIKIIRNKNVQYLGEYYTLTEEVYLFDVKMFDLIEDSYVYDSFDSATKALDCVQAWDLTTTTFELEEVSDYLQTTVKFKYL